MEKPIFKLPDKTKLISSDPWEDRKMILEIFCGYHDNFKGIFTKRDFRRLMFGSAGIENKIMRKIYEQAVRWEKNPGAWTWNLIKEAKLKAKGK